MAVLYNGLQKIAPVVVEGGGSSGKYQLLQRIKDDSNNEIGTVSGFFTDSNDVEYAVVCLDAQYRLASATWCSSTSSITDMPMYPNAVNSYPDNMVWDSKETATMNTQFIINYCNSSGSTSQACSHCRSKQFTIDETTYYGQLPNVKELLDIYKQHFVIEAADTSASTNPSLNEVFFFQECLRL